MNVNFFVDIKISCDTITLAWLATTKSRSREVEIEISRFAGSPKLRKKQPARAAADRSLKRQREVKARKGGGGPMFRRAEEIRSSQERRKTEVSESRRNPKPARAADDPSSREQKALKLFGVDTGRIPQGV
jgi:hypothetical protein